MPKYVELCYDTKLFLRELLEPMQIAAVESVKTSNELRAPQMEMSELDRELKTALLGFVKVKMEIMDAEKAAREICDKLFAGIITGAIMTASLAAGLWVGYSIGSYALGSVRSMYDEYKNFRKYQGSKKM